MEVIPAIDLRSGRCVRLYQGDYQRETVYSEDPVAMALHWQQQGAPRLHLVDLDGAADGRPRNLGILSQIMRSLSIPVQVGGGIRDEETAQSLLTAGADRVVLGTAAVEHPSLVEYLCSGYGADRIVVAIDARDGQVAIKGWKEQSAIGVLDLARKMASLGVTRLLYTDISRDGTLTQPNVETNASLVRDTGMAVLASGGVTAVEHLRLLAGVGVEGAILGRALYDGVIALPDAITAAAAENTPGA